MGNRGPIPKPSVIEIMQGRPGHRPINANEPQPRAVAPRCPDYLDTRAKKEWKRLVPILQRMRVLTDADGIALGNLCQTYSTMLKAQEKLNELGILYKSPSGYVMQSPILNIVTGCIDTLNKLSREFGLTPASRCRLSTSTPNDGVDPLERALCGD